MFTELKESNLKNQKYFCQIDFNIIKKFVFNGDYKQKSRQL